MPTPYLEQDEGSVESIAEHMSDLPDEVLTGVPDEKDAADEAQASAEQEVEDKPTDEAPEEVKAEPEKEEAKEPEEDSPDTVLIGEDEIPLTDLVDAYQSRQSDSVQLDARVEELTRNAERQVAEQVQPILEQRQQLVQQLERVKMFSPLPAEPAASLLDPNSETYNPDRYHQQRAALEQASKQMGEIDRHIADQKASMTQEQSRVQQQEDVRQTQLLKEKWPELTGENGAALVKSFAHDLERMYGIDPATVDSIKDHRFYLLARDALAHRRMGEKTPEIRRKAAQAPKLIKSGAKSKAPTPASKASTDARKKLAKSGSLTDAAAAFEQFL